MRFEQVNPRQEIVMRRAHFFLILACLFVHPSHAVAASEPFALFRTGMTGDEVMNILKGHCSDQQIGPPFITCVGDGNIITGVTTKQDHLFWSRLIHPTIRTAKDYGTALAAEMGFPGGPKDCTMMDIPTKCWTAEDGSTFHIEPQLKDGSAYVYIFSQPLLTSEGQN
jgi:hypothetical protein